MSPSSFCYWCHGWSEINGGGAPNALQWQIIVDHLNLVLSEREAAAAPKAVPFAHEWGATLGIATPSQVPMIPYTGLNGTVTYISGVPPGAFINVC